MRPIVQEKLVHVFHMIDLNEWPSLSTMFNYLVVQNPGHMHCTHGNLTFKSMSVMPTDKEKTKYKQHLIWQKTYSGYKPQEPLTAIKPILIDKNNIQCFYVHVYDSSIQWSAEQANMKIELSVSLEHFHCCHSHLGDLYSHSTRTQSVVLLRASKASNILKLNHTHSKKLEDSPWLQVVLVLTNTTTLGLSTCVFAKIQGCLR